MTLAVAPVRFDAVSLTSIEKGFYVARRVSWIPNSGWTIVMVDDPKGELRVFEPGAPKSDPVGKWVFHSMINGFQDMDDSGAPMSRQPCEVDPARPPFSRAC